MTRIALVVFTAALALSSAARAAPAQDLADAVQGQFQGDVIADARGPSKPGVTITVTKVGPDTVRVSSSYKRMPTFTVQLTGAMQTIQQVQGPQVFLLDLSKAPQSLMVTDDDANWSGVRAKASKPITCKEVSPPVQSGAHFSLATCR